MAPSEELTLAADRLEALDAAATPGPVWEVDDGEVWRPTPIQSAALFVAHPPKVADAAFIAAMRGVVKPLAAWLRWAAMETQRSHRSPQLIEPIRRATTLAREIIRATGGAP